MKFPALFAFVYALLASAACAAKLIRRNRSKQQSLKSAQAAVAAPPDIVGSGCERSLIHIIDGARAAGEVGPSERRLCELCVSAAVSKTGSRCHFWYGATNASGGGRVCFGKPKVGSSFRPSCGPGGCITGNTWIQERSGCAMIEGDASASAYPTDIVRAETGADTRRCPDVTPSIVPTTRASDFDLSSIGGSDPSEGFGECLETLRADDPHAASAAAACFLAEGKVLDKVRFTTREKQEAVLSIAGAFHAIGRLDNELRLAVEGCGRLEGNEGGLATEAAEARRTDLSGAAGFQLANDPNLRQSKLEPGFNGYTSNPLSFPDSSTGQQTGSSVLPTHRSRYGQTFEDTFYAPAAGDSDGRNAKDCWDYNRNVIAYKRSSSAPPESSAEADSWPLLLLGAHFDTKRGIRGANDNGSGVAVLLATALMLSDAQDLPFDIAFVAFDNEEEIFVRRMYANHPKTLLRPAHGSECFVRRHERELRRRLDLAVIMDCVGAYSHEDGSQGYLGFSLAPWKQQMLWRHKRPSSTATAEEGQQYRATKGWEGTESLPVAERPPAFGSMKAKLISWAMGSWVEDIDEHGRRGDFLAVISINDDKARTSIEGEGGPKNSRAKGERMAEVLSASMAAAQAAAHRSTVPVRAVHATVPWALGVGSVKRDSGLRGELSDFARSDHESFWRAKLNAVMLTDTADMRSACYHANCDTMSSIGRPRNAEELPATLEGVAQVTSSLVHYFLGLGVPVPIPVPWGK
jgi:hypothetical protein